MNKLNQEIQTLRTSIEWTQEHLITAEEEGDEDLINYYHTRLIRFTEELNERLGEIND